MTRRGTEGRAGRALLVLALWIGGCTVAPRPVSPAPTAAPDSAAPWQLPAARLGQQSLFRLRVDGPEGEGTLRLLLRLIAPTRYQLLVSDRLGRALYALDAADGSGRLIDHQKSRVCLVDDAFELEGVPLEPIPLSALPALLLGRLPEAPGPESPTLPRDGEASFTDRRGRQWSVTLAAGEPVAWSLAEGGQPALWWRRTGRESQLSDRVRGVQLTWEETLREPLGGELAALVVPRGYREGCDG